MNLKHGQEAPGQLETVRDFLNTWRIPNDSRMCVDELHTIDDVLQFMRMHFNEELSFGTVDELKRFRDEIRFAVEGKEHYNSGLKNIYFACV